MTSVDIYEFDDESQIVMGRGTGDRVGVLSLYRFDPTKKSPPKKKPKKRAKRELPSNMTEEESSLWLMRACKTMVHEMMHMFGT